MAADRPRLLCLSAYEAASHRQWRERLAGALTEFDWRTLTLPARHFRWRIRGNPLSWYDAPELQEPPDLVLATSMVDLAVVRGLNRGLAAAPTVVYFHENQFAYPEQRERVASNEPRVVNLYTALAADRVLFNSEWNRRSFLEGARALLKRMPDRKPKTALATIEARSQVVPVPVPDAAFTARSQDWPEVPHLVWNHRWEYDKGPERLLALLRGLRQQGQAFRLSLVGEGFQNAPEAFARIKEEFAGQLVNLGYMTSREAYDELLRGADMVLSTALHDFQGLAVQEAMAAGCVPIVPDRLAYPEYVAPEWRYASHEADLEQEGHAAAERVRAVLARPRPGPEALMPERYRLSRVIPEYRHLLASWLGQ
ncbi:tRNA-queuosine alpha-mannosyltransferase domain-containing protein [Halomonadaceae bacterium KBTZ08]